MNKTWPIIWPASAVKIFYKKTLLKIFFRRVFVCHGVCFLMASSSSACAKVMAVMSGVSRL